MRRLLGVGASAALHAVTLLVIVRLAAQISLAIPAGASPATVMLGQVASLPGAGRVADSADPPIDAAASEDLGIQSPDTSTFSLPGFTFDFSKVIRRAGALFPFLTGRLTLERIVAGRPVDAHLTNPLAT